VNNLVGCENCICRVKAAMLYFFCFVSLASASTDLEEITSSLVFVVLSSLQMSTGFMTLGEVGMWMIFIVTKHMTVLSSVHFF
jgi:hypothetical protein